MMIASWSGRARAQQAPAPSNPPSDDARRGTLMPSSAAASQTTGAQTSAPANAPTSGSPGSIGASGSGSGSGSVGPAMTTAPGSASGAANVSGLPAINPSQDAQSLAAQGGQRPGASMDGSIGASPNDVYSEDWWSHTRPILELHGYFRTRAELFHNFTLGRHDNLLWPQPLDNSYYDTGAVAHNVQLCGTPDATNGTLQTCNDKSQASANIRFRMNPELHISDNLRIMSQVDALDNLVLGSTPDSYAMQPTGKGTTGYGSAGYSKTAPNTFFSTTQSAPTAGVNGYRNSIDVKRVWAEYMTPVGQLRFGRMPDHWGLGMLRNSGDGIDSDYQTTTDRIMFVSGVKSIDFYFGGGWDFVSTGPTSGNAFDVTGGQPYNTSNNSNVGEWMLFAARRMNPDLQRHALARGEMVLNGGIYALYRSQLIDVQGGQTAQTVDTTATNNGLERRGASAFIPDPWVQLLWKKLRVEAEFAAIWGSIDNSTISGTTQPPVKIRQFGFTTQTELKAVEDKLRLQFGFGWASGDPWAASLQQGSNGLTPELNNRGPISTFAFNPDYRVDLIFFRHLLSRVEGAYYFRPSVDYDFLKNAAGQKFGGGAAIIWSRASEFIQSPGHKRDLGVELDLSLYYQAKDGTLNDNPDRLGGFYAMLQYGVFFPLGGLSYLPGETNTALPPGQSYDTSAAQTVRLFLGVAY